MDCGHQPEHSKRTSKMSSFERIHVEGFRRLNNVDLKLKPLNVLIGANGCGKTSLLDVFSLLAASAAGELNSSLSESGGIDANLSNLKAADAGASRFIAFDLAMPVPGCNPLEYRLAISPRGVAYEIVDETLTHQRAPAPPPFKHIEARHGDVRYFEQQSGLVRPNWEYNASESALSQVPKMFQEPEDFRKRLASSTHYHVLDVRPRAPIRLPQPMRDAKLPGRDGEDLVSCLYTLRETDPDRFETIQATLRAGFPAFERLNFPPVAAGTLAMTWKDKTSKHPFYMHQLSEGTLRFLWLVTLLQSPGLTAVTLIDEPEVSLHPELLSLLADLMREASQRTQLIVATHADRLVRYLKPCEVLTIEINDAGAAEMTWADELDLEQWLDEYTLDEVWRLGRMGARS
jgi:predicted ATPase